MKFTPINKSILILLSVIIAYGCRNKCSVPQDIIVKTGNRYFEKHNFFMTTKDVWGNYTLDLTFEAMLYSDMLAYQNHFTKRILDIMKKRNRYPGDTIPYESQPFCSINFALFEVTGDSLYIAPYVYESSRMKKNVFRSPEGAICINHEGKNYLLIDYLQEYCSRMAKTGYLTHDTIYYSECINQYFLYRDILRNPKNGLWSQGRGWLDNDSVISPGAWSRGHGWLMRGIVTSMNYLPKESEYFTQMQKLLIELSDSLLNHQDSEGIWHQLPDMAFEKSYPETSGSGMIAYYLALAIHHGWLNDMKYRNAVEKTFRSIKKYVFADGTVINSCKGPGPLYSIKDYLGNLPEPGEEHGYQAMIYCITGEILLNCL